MYRYVFVHCAGATLRGATFNGLVVQCPAAAAMFLIMQRFGTWGRTPSYCFPCGRQGMPPPPAKHQRDCHVRMCVHPVGCIAGSDVSAPLPSVVHTFLTLAASLVFMEAVFYFTHRLQHHPALYQRFHKKVCGVKARSCLRGQAVAA